MSNLKTKKELFLATSPLWGKILGIATYLLVITLLIFEDWTAFLEKINPYRYPFRWLGFAGFVLGGPYVILHLFTQTTFTADEIIHRNFLFQTKRKPYDDVTNIRTTRLNLIEIRFRDGSAFKIDCGESRLVETIEVLASHLHTKVFEWNRGE